MILIVQCVNVHIMKLHTHLISLLCSTTEFNLRYKHRNHHISLIQCSQLANILNTQTKSNNLGLNTCIRKTRTLVNTKR